MNRGLCRWSGLREDASVRAASLPDFTMQCSSFELVNTTRTSADVMISCTPQHLNLSWRLT